MPKFRKRPVIIEAVQHLGTIESNNKIAGLMGVAEFLEGKVIIKTLEGVMKADVGDWIIKGVNGEFYPCKPDIFEKTYEPVVTPDPMDRQMKHYIGTKIVQAMPEQREDKEGYKVVYEDGYTSWSPRDVFEKAYLEVTPNPNRPSKVSIDEQMVKDFIASVESTRVGEKTTIVIATLKNGFEITETSSCVDKANYDQELGTKICMKRIENKVWELLGFLLQTGYKGINN